MPPTSRPIVRFRKRDKAAALVAEEASWRLVVYWAGVYRRRPVFRNVEFEELVQEGWVGLLYAAKRFNPNKNCQFLTYASKWVRSYLRRFELRLRNHSDTCTCDPDLLDAYSVPGGDLTIPDDATPTVYPVEGAEIHSLLTASMNCLDTRSRDIIAATYGFGQPEEATAYIAQRLGMSVRNVHRIKERGLRLLKNSEFLSSFASR